MAKTEVLAALRALGGHATSRQIAEHLNADRPPEYLGFTPSVVGRSLGMTKRPRVVLRAGVWHLEDGGA